LCGGRSSKKRRRPGDRRFTSTSRSIALVDSPPAAPEVLDPADRSRRGLPCRLRGASGRFNLAACPLLLMPLFLDPPTVFGGSHLDRPHPPNQIAQPCGEDIDAFTNPAVFAVAKSRQSRRIASVVCSTSSTRLPLRHVWQASYASSAMSPRMRRSPRLPVSNRSEIPSFF